MKEEIYFTGLQDSSHWVPKYPLIHTPKEEQKAQLFVLSRGVGRECLYVYIMNLGPSKRFGDHCRVMCKWAEGIKFLRQPLSFLT